MRSLPMDVNSVAAADVDTRATFVGRCYSHLFGAIMLFTGLEVVLFQTGANLVIFEKVQAWGFLPFLVVFMVGGWIFTRVASSARSLPAQYGALAAYVAIEAVIFVPLLTIADEFAPGVISSAVWVTLGGFSILTLIAFTSRKDFTFLGTVLKWGGICALGLIVVSIFGGFALGPIFSVAMIALAGAAILYDTSNVLHHYPEDRYVSASLQLFASVALMFWYVIQLFLAFGDD